MLESSQKLRSKKEMARHDQAASAPPFDSSNPEIDHQLSDTQLVATHQIHQQQAQPQTPKSLQNNQAMPMQPVQFPPQNPQTFPLGSLQAPVQYLPQVPQNNLLHFAHPGPNHQTSSASMSQTSQYPLQAVPNNYHFHSINIQPSVAPVHFVPVNVEAYPGAQSTYSNFAPSHQLPVYVRNPNTVSWTTGLFDCMDDPLNALVTLCLPCVTFGQVAEIVDNGTTSCATSGLIYAAIACLIGCPCFLSCTYRTKLRSRYDLIESAGPDWVAHFLCEYCALCQEYRELQNRGLDPSIGWHANVARNQSVQLQYHVNMVPPTNQHMMG